MCLVNVVNLKWMITCLWMSPYRDKRLATFQVDTGPAVTILSTPGATQLDTDGYLWLGENHTLCCKLKYLLLRPIFLKTS